MGKQRDWADDYTLLCEQCGYPLESLPPDGACPECGKPIRDSLPAARTGSAWQRRPGPRAWLAAGWALLIRPAPLFSRINVGPGSTRWLTRINMCLSGALAAIVPLARTLAGRHWFVPWAPRTSDIPGAAPAWYSLWIVLCIWAAVAALLSLLTWVETLGVRFFNNRRGWRVSRALAWSVCAHASYGWVVGSALLALGWALLDVDIAVARAMNATPLRIRLGDWMALPPALGFFAGMMLFEYRVYQGVRLCRFANTERPARG